MVATIVAGCLDPSNASGSHVSKTEDLYQAWSALEWKRTRFPRGASKILKAEQISDRGGAQKALIVAKSSMIVASKIL